MQLAMGGARHAAARVGATLVIVVALAMVSGFAGSAALAAAGRHAGASRHGAGAPAPKKAVIVAGPMGADSAKYHAKAAAVAKAAEARGMQVVRLFAPHATWSQVVAEANGADLFVYIGHGNGWPSPYPPFQEDSKDGLGLDPTDGASLAEVKYYGANKIVSSIRFAPNAIVFIGSSCYAAGNGEEGQTIPSRGIAVQRIDNFASGFLAAGARTVFALRIQPGEDLVDALFTQHETMDGFFQSRFGGNSDGSYMPYYGWVGQKPDLYFDSVRTPGASLHIDPDHAVAGHYAGDGRNMGYMRAVTGDLGMTTDEWLGGGGGGGGGDSEPPVSSGLSVVQAADTIPVGDGALPVFTPNGDGISDTLTIKHTLSEPAYLDVSIAKPDGGVVRHFTDWSEQGPTSSRWDGKNRSGRVVVDGRYDITVVPKDRAGNVGQAATTSVKVLTAMKAPSLSPRLFNPGDGDALAQVTEQSLTLTEPASLRWRMLDKHGKVVRVGIAEGAFPAGPVGWSWDGLDDAGHPLPNGSYTSLVTATTEAGSYSHELTVKLMPFSLTGRLSVSPGQKVKLTLTTAEPMVGWPHIDIKQPGLAPYRLFDVRYSATRFTATWRVRAGASGAVRIAVSGTDADGGYQSQVIGASVH